MKFEVHIIPLSFMHYLLLSIFISMLSVSHAANGGDMQALLSIRDHIIKDPFGKLAFWNNSFHFCNWTGISCYLNQKWVLGIDLSDFQLTGTLSPSIGNLTFLKDLNLENNTFSGSIPQQISKLYHLKHLLLSNNSFSGEIPRNLSYSLEIIRLDMNDLKGTIPVEIGSLSNLLVLDISLNILIGSIPQTLGNLSVLEGLSLSYNGFSGLIPQEISQLYHLKNLVPFSNSFSGEIPRNLSYSLEMIGLDRNELTGTIPAEIGFLSNLIDLDISENYLNGRIPSTFGNLSALEGLFLSYNNFEGIIPREFGKLSSLQYLDLSSNQLTGALPLMLQNITSLINITLANNMFSGSLPWDFGLYLPNLQRFYVAGNHFTGDIPASITNASVLTFLDISNNSFSGQVPMDLGRITRLNRLDLSYNNLGCSKTVGLEFINSLTNCSSLEILHLHFNQLWGVLPSSIANLSPMLTSLRLDGNGISGEIPDRLDNLKNLVRLALSQNYLTGTIPDSIGNLSSLQSLNLSNNAISGGIPSSLGNLIRLSALEMQRNKLSGGIPASLGNCKRLQVLDLSGNMLRDDIPTSIVQISSLTYLSLAHNYFSGHFPVKVGGLIMLTTFDVSDNLLTGALPPALSSYISLEFFSAQSNRFYGSIPIGFSYFTSMQFLDLSFNSLEGEVPSEGLFINYAAFSIAGNQKLCGGIKSLQLPECPKEGKLKFSVAMVLPAISVVIFMSIAYVCVFYYRACRARIPSIREPMNSLLGDQYPKLSYTELLQATDGFSTATLSGMGRYSWAYKGYLTGYEHDIAIKVIKLDQSGSRRSFVAECEALKHIRHRNLVKIITSCSGTDFKGNEFKALVYGFMGNGNLDNWLHPKPSESKNLNFIQRLGVAIDVATVLAYLHHNCEIPFVHRDIKPSNVLLDDELCAHLGDFGSARSLLLPVDRTNCGRVQSSYGIVGTVGYIALECAIGGPVSTLVDVYSYGILLLEMFSGKRPTDSIFKDDFSLHNYVKMAIPDQVMSIADPRLLDECVNNRVFRMEFEKCLASVFRVGVICSAQVPRERMEIADALVILQTIRDAIPKLC